MTPPPNAPRGDGQKAFTQTRGQIMATIVAPERKYTGIMAEMNESGDTKIIWDKDQPDEVDTARAAFDKLTKDRKYIAFHVKGRDGEQGERMRKFDPEAERIILVPQMQGG